MRYIIKFNEINSGRNLSVDRIGEILNDLREISSEIDSNFSKCYDFTEELSQYVTKSEESNNQIDDAFVDFKSLNDKLKESTNLVTKIIQKLENYSKEGPKIL